MEKVLFICVHNSARSQMAEAFLKKHANKDEIEVESAGFEPTEINPFVVEVMQEVGIDLSEKKTQSVFDLFKAGKIYSFVMTVCGEGDGQCPVFPGMVHRLHLPFPDPAAVEGTKEEKLAQIRLIRDDIERNIIHFIEWSRSGMQNPLDLVGN
ncbi:arsenate reductase ArsC [Pseudodesulfovibrio piezophilus]|uniref:Protein ArsC n=1 Tax=Pseudodesulfovibrio piezophilus (strain DSM 21447 / JCM 15486 / C1TLV30) TaxID=1322246 RepID=M1WJS4_PSEP2|nr:arsenate reductase ArsC [Pseudodesulfovibrio piezophilus]CCH48401.1 Protein ArsC [Pseudodesulfovibrio piezophilus C1TLV30]